MQAQLSNKIIHTLILIGLLFSLTTGYCLATFAFQSEMGALITGFIELVALPVKWIVVSVIFTAMIAKKYPTPQFPNFAASFAKIYGLMTFLLIGFILPVGIFALDHALAKFFLVTIPVMFQILMPFLAVLFIPGLVLSEDTENPPVKA